MTGLHTKYNYILELGINNPSVLKELKQVTTIGNIIFKSHSTPEAHV